jgi:hypothetical protein
MQMQTYSERIRAVVSECSLSVQVLLSRDNDDLEFVRVEPQRAYMPPEELAARKLRSVGFVGLSGLKPRCAFAEPLEPPVVNAIAEAFAEYIRVLLGENFAEHIAAAEVAELHRLFGLPDPRMN